MQRRRLAGRVCAHGMALTSRSVSQSEMRVAQMEQARVKVHQGPLSMVNKRDDEATKKFLLSR